MKIFRLLPLFKSSSQACNFIKKETLAQVFLCEFCEISKNTFFTETSGRLLLSIFDLTVNTYKHKHLHYFYHEKTDTIPCSNLKLGILFIKTWYFPMNIAKYCKIFKNTYFYEHLQTAASG